MIKILLIHPHAESYADGIASHCNSLYSLFRNIDGIEILKPENYPYRRIKVFNGLFRFMPLLRAIRESKADIVHVHGYTTLQVGQALLTAVLCRKRIIYSPHWHPFHELRRPLMARLFYYLTIAPLVRTFAKACVGINKEDSAFLRKMGKPVYTIPHWISDSLTKEQHHAQKKSNMIMFVGRFDASNKGIDYLWHLEEGKYDIHLVGKGDISPRSDMTIHTNISQSELYALYRKSSLVVVPSQYEAFSLVTLEALALGTPVVISDKVRIADYLDSCDGVTIFRYGDYDAFSVAVANQIGKTVDTEKIYQIFSGETALKQYSDMYSKIMKG